MQGYDEVRRHPYFKNINFDLLSQRMVPTPCQEVFTVDARTLDTYRETSETDFSVSSK